MPSPFPGMNSFLEQDDAWHNFHEDFIPALKAQLVPQLAPAYIVKNDENVYIHELSAEERVLLGAPDLGITHSNKSGTLRAAPAAVRAPFRARVPAPVEIERLSFLEIRDRESR